LDKRKPGSAVERGEDDNGRGRGLRVGSLSLQVVDEVWDGGREWREQPHTLTRHVCLEKGASRRVEVGGDVGVEALWIAASVDSEGAMQRVEASKLVTRERVLVVVGEVGRA
jgi:hypothetical protein